MNASKVGGPQSRIRPQSSILQKLGLREIQKALYFSPNKVVPFQGRLAIL